MFIHTGFIVYMLYAEPHRDGQGIPPLGLLGISLVVCSGFVYLVNYLSALVAERLKRKLVLAKLVTSMPVHSPALLKKWQDRCWQLIVHVTMTAIEIYILNTDLSGLWTNMDLAFEPLPFYYQTPYSVRLLYIVQFVRGACIAPRFPLAPV